MFESQHDWFEHEVNFHRKLWECKLCTDRLPRSKPELNSHLQDHHAGSSESVDPQKVESWQKLRIDATECPLCCAFAGKLKAANNSQKCDVMLKQFRSHLGGHFEQLALAALPNDVEGVAEITEDVSSDDGEDDEAYKNKVQSDGNSEASVVSRSKSSPLCIPLISAISIARGSGIDDLQGINIESTDDFPMRLQNHSEDDGNGSGDGDNGNLTYRGGKSVDKEGSVVTVPEAEAAHQEELEEEKENERIENVRQARLVREQAAREEEKRQREAVRQAKALAPSGADEQEPVRFKDAVGRKFSFPFELCATWAVSTI